jgi:hypothetical protein
MERPRSVGEPALVQEQEIIAALQASRPALRPVELGELLLNVLENTLSQGTFVRYFKVAFPDVPLKELIPASTWHRIEGGSLSDAEFDSLLRPWLRGESTSDV